MHRYFRLAANCSLAGLVIVVIVFWFFPVRVGERQLSPDGKFTAAAFNSSRGTLFRGRIKYVELQVTESVSDRTLWQAEIHHLDESQAPDYSIRQDKPLIVWAQDSASVTFPGGFEQPITLPVE